MLRVPYPEFDGSQNCAQFGLEIMHEEPTSSSGAENRWKQVAKMVCTGCPFKRECAEWAIHHEKYGIWGGLTALDRRRIRRKRNITVLDPYFYYVYGESANGAEYRDYGREHEAATH